MPTATKLIRVELKAADLIKIASSVKGLINARTAASASAVRVEIAGKSETEPNWTPREGVIVAYVTFEFKGEEPVT